MATVIFFFISLAFLVGAFLVCINRGNNTNWTQESGFFAGCGIALLCITTFVVAPRNLRWGYVPLAFELSRNMNDRDDYILVMSGQVSGLTLVMIQDVVTGALYAGRMDVVPPKHFIRHNGKIMEWTPPMTGEQPVPPK